MHNHQIISKGIQLINTQQIQLNLTKTQLSNILADLLMSEDNAALIRAINPVLADKFPQFPEFTNVNLTEVNEDGTGTVTLRVPPATKGTKVPADEAEVATDPEDENVTNSEFDEPEA